jgi:hypothetical protein
MRGRILALPQARWIRRADGRSKGIISSDGDLSGLCELSCAVTAAAHGFTSTTHVSALELPA